MEQKIVNEPTLIDLDKRVAKNKKAIDSVRFNRPCYETGLEDATYTADTKDIFTGSTDILEVISNIGLATSEVISLDKLDAYNITVKTIDASGSTTVEENKTYRLSDLNSQPISACGYKFYVPADGGKFIPEAAVLVISDYKLFNERYPEVELTSNGVYLAKNEWDSSKYNDNGVLVYYTNSSEVVSIESFAIQKLDNMFLNLLENEDFKAFKEKVEKGEVNGWNIEPEKISMADWDTDESKIDITSQRVHINRAGNEVYASFPIRSGTILTNTDLDEFSEGLSEELVEVVGGINDRLDALEEGGSGGGNEIITTTGTGEAYEATVPSITELKTGVSFIMVPHINNSTPLVTLNVNGFGAKSIYRHATDGSSYSHPKQAFLKIGRAYRVFYDGNGWILTDYGVPSATDLRGVVPVANGGVPTTSADNAGKVLTTNEEGTPEWQTSSGVSGATLDKIISTDFAFGNNDGVNITSDGISFYNDEVEIETGEGVYYHNSSSFRLPIVAGEGVTFELDEENQVVKVNASLDDFEATLDSILDIQNGFIDGTTGSFGKLYRHRVKFDNTVPDTELRFIATVTYYCRESEDLQESLYVNMLNNCAFTGYILDSDDSVYPIIDIYADTNIVTVVTNEGGNLCYTEIDLQALYGCEDDYTITEV